MLKFAGAFDPKREAHPVGLGLSDVNIDLLKQGRPVLVKSEDIGLPEPGLVISIFYAKDKAGIEETLKKAFESYQEEIDEGTITVLHLDGAFYMTFYVSTDGRVVYLIGFDDVSLIKLRAQDLLTFRSRSQTKGQLSVEIIMFWAPTEDDLVKRVQLAGLMDETTDIIDHRQ